jgi:hypothetical protein
MNDATNIPPLSLKQPRPSIANLPIEKVEDLAEQLQRPPIFGSDPAGGSGGLISYTFTACVNGTPMNFDIPIYRGPY